MSDIATTDFITKSGDTLKNYERSDGLNGDFWRNAMNLQERIDEMYRQLGTTKKTSKKKLKDLKKGIAKAEYQRRKEKRGGTIII